MDDLDELKRALRQRMKTTRRALDPDTVARMAADAAARTLALPEVAGARLVLCYVAVRTELPTEPLIDALRAAGRPVAVPRVEGDGLRAHLVTDAPLRPGAFGVPTSDGPDVTDQIDVCLTPGLAFTCDGHRLGYGGGYYDRFLAAHPRVVPIGLCFDVQLIGKLPMDLHDHPMRIVVTPGETHRVPPDA